MHSLQDVQARLIDAGFFHGVADGVETEESTGAIRNFQASVGLHADGLPGYMTQIHLFPEDFSIQEDRDADPVEAGPAGIAPIWPRQRDLEVEFGPPGQNLAHLALPFPMRLTWGTKLAQGFLIHEKVRDSALRCLERIADAYDENARRDLGIDVFGGCFNVRLVRGGSRLSVHSWAAAIDFDPYRNPIAAGADQARLAQPDAETFWRIWEEEGWVSLGRARNYEWGHIQAARF